MNKVRAAYKRSLTKDEYRMKTAMSSSKCSMWGGSLVAHEIGHGVYKFQHTFDYGVAEKSTDNLMDYNNGDFLAHYQWRVIDLGNRVDILVETDSKCKGAKLEGDCKNYKCNNLTADENALKKAFGYIDTHLYEYNQPIVTGVHYSKGNEKCTTANTPRIINHWILIVGKNKDDLGTCYYNNNPGKSNSYDVNSKLNILRVYDKEHMIKDDNATSNHGYDVGSFRFNKKNVDVK